MAQTPEEYLESIREQLAEAKADVDYPDRDRVMRRLRKERRKLEKQLGVKPKNGSSKTTNGRKAAKKAVDKATSISDTPKETAKKERRKRKRESVSTTKNATVADASEKFLDNPPDHFIDWLKEHGYIDRRQDPSAKKVPLFCITIERKDADRDPTYVIEKFEERWGTKPEYFTYLTQGRFTMLALAPIPTRY